VSAAGVDVWSRRLGHIWARELRQHEVPPAGTVVEIGPGFAAKIGCGLAELAFHGTIILVEPTDPARDVALKQYRELLPEATVLACHEPVPEAPPLAGRGVDLLAANHILDDLLLRAHLPGPDGDRVFARMLSGEDCSTEFMQAWHDLLAAPARLRQLTDQVTDEMCRYIDAVRPRLVLLCQYRSGHHVHAGLTSIHPHTMRVMRRLRDQLAAETPGATDVQVVREQFAHWLVARPRAGLSSPPGRAGR
jgi:hypothetical protein